MEIKIDSLAFLGNGVGRCDNKVYFVPFSVPGDVLEIRSIKNEKRYTEAEIVKIVSPSEWRRTPVCSHFGKCGGCNWQHISYEKQLAEKKLILLHNLQRLGGIKNPSIRDIISSPTEYHYRNRVRLKCGPNGEIGFYEPKTHSLVALSECSILETAVWDTIEKLREQIALSTEKPSEIEIHTDENGKVTFSFLHNSGKGGGLATFGQANHAQNRNLRAQIRNYILQHTAKPLRILDLFCGNGNLSLHLSDIAGEIIGYDASQASIDSAGQIVQALHIDNVSYRRGAISTLRNILSARATDTDCLILDPPRTGLSRHEQYVCRMRVPLVFYVSCSPPILARDLKLFLKAGYSLELVQPLDMFPQTYHLETIAVLRFDPLSSPKMREKENK